MILWTALRKEMTEDQALLQALDGYALQLRAGVREPPRTHIRRIHAPVPDEQFRAGRLADGRWASILAP